MKPSLLLHAAWSLLLAASLRADITPAPLFRDGAVLQQGKPVAVWGRAEAGEKVIVAFGTQKKEATAAADGRWKVMLDPLAASATGSDLTMTGKNTVTVKDVLVGEVWICSGQSNMAWTVERAKDFPAEAAAANFPLIRHFKVAQIGADSPADTAEGDWVACTPATVKDFSAAGYFFGRELHKVLGVPIGLVNTSYGGTPVESWMSQEALSADPGFGPVSERWKKNLEAYPALSKVYEERLAKWQADKAAAAKEGKEFKIRAPRKPDGPGSRMAPSALYHAMVHPLIPYAVRGIIWYQGEANAARFNEYGKLITAMVKQWRKDFGQGDLPFYYVQLANLERKPDASAQQWAFQREAQGAVLDLPNTGAALAIDIGDPENIHPANKQEVGRRLALIALAQAYEKGGEYAGPVFRSAKADGAAMRVAFDHASGLKFLNGTAAGFEVAGADQVFHPAAAEISGEEVLVKSAAVPAPVSVRYAWRNNPEVSLYNAAGLPASPFRSDNWAPPANAFPEAISAEAN
ncbi:MAG TPA: sialate O-acetylesterase [Terrimicrobiaceae bacterium]|nr:sialate O-acetylesterase [Terrimicrobiaceae bacterium]